MLTNQKLLTNESSKIFFILKSWQTKMCENEIAKKGYTTNSKYILMKDYVKLALLVV